MGSWFSPTLFKIFSFPGPFHLLYSSICILLEMQKSRKNIQAIFFSTTIFSVALVELSIFENISSAKYRILKLMNDLTKLSIYCKGEKTYFRTDKDLHNFLYDCDSHFLQLSRLLQKQRTKLPPIQIQNSWNFGFLVRNNGCKCNSNFRASNYIHAHPCSLPIFIRTQSLYLDNYAGELTVISAFILELIFIASFASKQSWFFAYPQIYMLVLSSCSKILKYKTEKMFKNYQLAFPNNLNHIFQESWKVFWSWNRRLRNADNFKSPLEWHNCQFIFLFIIYCVHSVDICIVVCLYCTFRECALDKMYISAFCCIFCVSRHIRHYVVGS